MIILGASMTPQLQVGLEGWVFHRPDQWFGKWWGSYDIHLPSTEFFTKQIYTYITKKSIRSIRPKCWNVWFGDLVSFRGFYVRFSSFQQDESWRRRVSTWGFHGCDAVILAISSEIFYRPRVDSWNSQVKWLNCGPLFPKWSNSKLSCLSEHLPAL